MVSIECSEEALANAIHELWVSWARPVLEQEPSISEDRRDRWKTFFVPYKDLEESEKEKDRVSSRFLLSHLK